MEVDFEVYVYMCMYMMYMYTYVYVYDVYVAQALLAAFRSRCGALGFSSTISACMLPCFDHVDSGLNL